MFRYTKCAIKIKQNLDDYTDNALLINRWYSKRQFVSPWSIKKNMHSKILTLQYASRSVVSEIWRRQERIRFQHTAYISSVPETNSFLSSTDFQGLLG